MSELILFVFALAIFLATALVGYWQWGDSMALKDLALLVKQNQADIAALQSRLDGLQGDMIKNASELQVIVDDINSIDDVLNPPKPSIQSVRR